MVNLLLSGVNAVELSKLSGESPQTLQTWLKSVNENGWDSLQAVKQTGRPSKLSDDQIATLKSVVSDDPNAYGYSNWDGPTLSDYIRKTFSIKYGVRACQKKRKTGKNYIKRRISERERVYLLYRFGLEDDMDHPLVGTALHFHLSESRARSTEALALDNLWLELSWWY